ncbi:MAG: hypothetical protein H6Q15_1413 [Bacteroidetes bacterium]|nr:hypothetical protein [Bacteroidota bacterium]
MKKVFILALAIASVGFVAFCGEKDSNPEKVISQQNQISKSLSDEELSNFFTSNSEITEFYEMLTVHFHLFPNSYVISRLGENPTTCDYGLGRFDSELGRKISLKMNNKTISTSILSTKEKNELINFKKNIFVKGSYIIASYDVTTKTYKLNLISSENF